MQYLFRLLLLITIGLLMKMVYAQNSGIVGCQGGVCTGPSWDPDWQISRGVQSPQVSQQYAPSPPPVKWEDRWGAIVIGYRSDKAGVVGVSANISNQTDAKIAAWNDCKSQGGKEETCTINSAYVYHNQCVAVAAAPAARAAMIADYPIEKTKQRAIEGCIEYGGKDCKVIYSGCSMAVRIQ
jgi:hypothetical protein